LGSPDPYGYEIVDGQLKPIDREAGVVSSIYHAYILGSSLDEIARKLNAQGIPGKKGGPWSKQMISKVLRNPIYCGYVQWDGHLMDLDYYAPKSTGAFNLVQDLMPERRRNRLGTPHRRMEARTDG
jgi:site-specific DNA recombinase